MPTAAAPEAAAAVAAATDRRARRRRLSDDVRERTRRGRGADRRGAATLAVGPAAVAAHFENMLDHNRAAQLSSRRIGLALALPFRGEQLPKFIEPERKALIDNDEEKAAALSTEADRLNRQIAIQQAGMIELPRLEAKLGYFATVARIAPFITRYGLDPTEFSDPTESFPNFNAFFFRKLKQLPFEVHATVSDAVNNAKFLEIWK